MQSLMELIIASIRYSILKHKTCNGTGSKSQSTHRIPLHGAIEYRLHITDGQMFPNLQSTRVHRLSHFLSDCLKGFGILLRYIAENPCPVCNFRSFPMNDDFGIWLTKKWLFKMRKKWLGQNMVLIWIMHCL